MQAAVFFLLSVASVVWLSPPLALAAGIFMAVTIGSYQAARVQKASKFLLQASVVGLGFGMHLGQVWAATADGFFYAVVTIFGTLALGALIGRWLKVESQASTLIASGTAICGGSAIAAVGAAIHADKEAMTVALATVFTLNAVALFLFPPIGELLELSQHQFGLWSAIAIHDTSSVVGAAAKYGDEALQIATTVKLTRALWILPLVAVIGMRQSQHGGKVSIPWFVFLFVGAAGLRQALPDAHATFDHLKQLARIGLTLTLFFIGSTMSKQAMRKIGIKPMLQGTLLWLLVSSLTLIAVRL
ncbi:MAG: putative sulfate exporter family transporter [Planctomycetes bacterium]|nr:putative sulfate exporter family transporter [Planctomycetota bacterium]